MYRLRFIDGGHEARRLQPQRDGGVRCCAWLGRVVIGQITRKSEAPEQQESTRRVEPNSSAQLGYAVLDG